MEKASSKVQLPINKAHRVISPRIAYIVTSVDKQGKVNAASFSNITSVSTEPERLVLAVYKDWDTLKNIRGTKEFVVNVPPKELIEQVWICGDKYAGNPIPRGVNELEVADLTQIPSEKIAPPRIAECNMHLECKMVWIKNVGNHYLILADIVSASSTSGSFDEDFIQNINQTAPLMEISSGFFTYPEQAIEVDREKAKNKVAEKLKKNE